MLRRPATKIMLTIDDIAAYEDRRAQAEQSKLNQTARMPNIDTSNVQPTQQDNKRSNLQAQVQALITPEAQSHHHNQGDEINESMMVDTDELDDSMVLHNNVRQQASFFTPPNAPVRGGPAQTRQRSRNERIGAGR